MKKDCQLMRNFSCGIDVNHYLKNCEYDMCSHDDISYQNSYLCQSMAAYALECVKLGMSVDWMSESFFKDTCTLSNYGVCANGQKFTDCSNTCLKTCKDLSVSDQGDNLCGNKCNQGKRIFA